MKQTTLNCQLLAKQNIYFKIEHGGQNYQNLTMVACVVYDEVDISLVAYRKWKVICANAGIPRQDRNPIQTQSHVKWHLRVHCGITVHFLDARNEMLPIYLASISPAQRSLHFAMKSISEGQAHRQKKGVLITGLLLIKADIRLPGSEDGCMYSSSHSTQAEDIGKSHYSLLSKIAPKIGVDSFHNGWF